jgi:hypothetical protein
MISTILLLTATAFLLAGILFAIRPGQVGSSAQEQLTPAERKHVDEWLAHLEEEGGRR